MLYGNSQHNPASRFLSDIDGGETTVSDAPPARPFTPQNTGSDMHYTPEDTLQVDVGARVKHQLFGIGAVVEVDGEMLSIAFKNKGIKKIKRKFCATGDYRMNQLKARLIKGVSFTILPVLYLLIHNSHRVRVLITYKDEILLQRSSVGHQKWSVPGGGVQRNESDEDAAIREVQEEVGIKLRTKDLKKLGWQRAPYNKGWPYMNLTFFHVQLEKKSSTLLLLVHLKFLKLPGFR
jgi:8-oxo-dGTP pyrophosphatase MutT (NUDIX family)